MTSDRSFDEHPGQPGSVPSQRRALIGTSVVFVVVCVAAVAGLTGAMFTSDSKAWNDDSQVIQTRGVVTNEVRGEGSCRGRGSDFETRVEWTQDGEVRSASTSTCHAGPDVGDTVDVWVRDDGEIELTAPSTTSAVMAIGLAGIVGLGLFVVLKLRSNLRRVDQ